VTVVAFAATLLNAVALAQNSSDAREQEAREVANAFMVGLGTALKNEMAKGGAAGAIKACSELAPEIASKLSREHGWQVTRVGTRVRNTMIGMPDVWEQQVLIQFAKRANKGESFKDMIYSEVVTEPNGRYFRFMKAIGVKPLCLTCHGSVEQIPPAVKTVLRKHYPSDRATDYRVGDLRGAISIKQPLESTR
jgi:hypothetical protein